MKQVNSLVSNLLDFWLAQDSRMRREHDLLVILDPVQVSDGVGNVSRDSCLFHKCVNSFGLYLKLELTSANLFTSAVVQLAKIFRFYT